MRRRWVSTLACLAVLLLLFVSQNSPVKATIASEITIERFVYDGQASQDGDEYVKICNISSGSIGLGGTNPWLIGDAESLADTGEGMYELQGTLNAGSCFIIALNANAFNSIWGFLPDYEMNPTLTGWTDNPSVPNLTKKAGFGTWGLSNTLTTGDNITLWKYNSGTSSYEKHDEAAYGTNSARYTEVGLADSGTYQITCGANANCALTRNSVSTDTDNMASDFNNSANPTAITLSSLTAASPLPVSLPVPGLVALGGLAAVAALGIGAGLVRQRRA